MYLLNVEMTYLDINTNINTRRCLKSQTEKSDQIWYLISYSFAPLFFRTDRSKRWGGNALCFNLYWRKESSSKPSSFQTFFYSLPSFKLGKSGSRAHPLLLFSNLFSTFFFKPSRRWKQRAPPPLLLFNTSFYSFLQTSSSSWWITESAK